MTNRISELPNVIDDVLNLVKIALLTFYLILVWAVGSQLSVRTFWRGPWYLGRGGEGGTLALCKIGRLGRVGDCPVDTGMIVLEIKLNASTVH